VKEFIVKLPLIAVQAVSQAEAYGLVMQWLQTTLSALPISNAVMIEPAQVTKAIEEDKNQSNVIDFHKYSKK